MKQNKVNISSNNYGSVFADKLVLLDYVAIPAVIVAIAIWVFQYLGTSIEWDDLFYWSVAHCPTKQSWIMNRYGHIYLVKLFLGLSGDAFIGAKIYWSTMFFGTILMIYYCAKKLAADFCRLIGIIAVLFFWTYWMFVHYAANTFSDFSVMFLLALAGFIYLTFFVEQKWQNYKHITITVLGFLFFWAIKSKETGICMAVFLFALGRDWQTFKWTLKQFLYELRWFILGVAAGCLLLMMFDWFFLGDGFFSLRPSTIKGLFDFNFRPYSHDKKSSSWYAIFAQSSLVVPFIFYLISGSDFGKNNKIKVTPVVWFIPMALLTFLLVSMTRVYCGTVSRFLFPAIPWICIFGAQYFNRFLVGKNTQQNKSDISKPKILLVITLFFAALGIVALLQPHIMKFVGSAGWQSQDKFYQVVILPLSLTLMLILGAACKRNRLGVIFVSFICLFFVVYPPILQNARQLKSGAIARRSQWRYAPYMAFEGQMDFTKDTSNIKVLVSKSIYEKNKMLGRDGRSHGWMFNLFFDKKLGCGNAITTARRAGQFINGSIEDIQKADYHYGFLTWSDWKILKDNNTNQNLLKKYKITSDKKTRTILLRARKDT